MHTRQIISTRFLLLVIILLAFCLRLSHYGFIKKYNPIFNLPIVDSAEYVKDAKYCLEQNWMGRCASYPHPPAYTYFLAILFKIFGVSLNIIKLFQIIIDLVSTCLIYFIAKKVFTKTIGLTAAAFYAVYIPSIFYSTEILPPTLAIFLLLVSIACLLRFYQQDSDSPNKSWLFLSGASFGLLMITIFNFIVSLPLILLWQYKYLKGSSTRRLVYVLIFAITSLSPVILATARNCLFAKDCAIVSRNGGTNFYIGNNQDIDKTVSVREGVEWVGLRMSPFKNEVIRNFEQLDASFYRKGWKFIVYNPGKWAWLMFKKTVFFFNAYELPRNFDFYFFSNYSAITRLPILRFNVVLPLAISALFCLWFLVKNKFNKPLLMLLMAILVSYSFSIIIFFVTGRYRLPVIPLFIILSAYYLVTFLNNLVHSNYRVAMGLLVLASSIGIITQQRFFEDSYRYKLDPSHTHAQIAKALLAANRADDAYGFIQKGLKGKIDESTYELYSLLGIFYATKGANDNAIASFNKSIELNKENLFAYNEIASLLIMDNKQAQAMDYLKQSINTAPYFPQTYMDLARLYSDAGDKNQAVTTLLLYNEYCASMHPLIEYSLGKYYMDSFRDFKKAAGHFEAADKYPQLLDHNVQICSDLFVRLGSCYSNLGNAQKAKDIWLKGERFFPRNEVIRSRLYKIY